VVVIAQKYGALGNRLFLFAHVVAAGIEHGFRVANPAFEEYAAFFESTAPDLFCRFPPQRSAVHGRAARRLVYAAASKTAAVLDRLGRGAVRAEGDDVVDLGDPGFVDRARREPLFLRGWSFRDERSLARHADTVRAFLRPRTEHVDAAERVLARLRDGAPVVGVHVRRGDYARFAGGRYLYDPAVYRRLMGEMRELLGGGARFLVCSDETQDPEAFEGLPAVLGEGHPVEDMLALAGCDYLLGPPSTYTGWASFYGRVPLLHVEHADERLSLEAFTRPGA
jgi:hypothetical protein